jgi:hypothetical protein
MKSHTGLVCFASVLLVLVVVVQLASARKWLVKKHP